MRNVIQAAQLNVPVAEEGCQGVGDVGKEGGKDPENGNARRAARVIAHRPPGVLDRRLRGLRYFSQASTLSRLASTHFLAAASSDILSTAMYLATVFWSSLVQLNFFTRP